MKKQEYLEAWRSSHGAPNNLFINLFLSVVYKIANALIFIRITPNRATVLGGVIGISAVWFVQIELWLVAALIAILSSLFDGIDGAIAEITGNKSKFGSILDAVTDRVVELSWFGSFIFAGADINAVVFLGLSILVMEYTRAKANSIGLTGPGVITIAERPTRVIMFVMLNVGVWIVGTDNSVLTTGVWLLALATIFGFIQLFRSFTNQLRNNSSR